MSPPETPHHRKWIGFAPGGKHSVRESNPPFRAENPVSLADRRTELVGAEGCNPRPLLHPTAVAGKRERADAGIRTRGLTRTRGALFLTELQGHVPEPPSAATLNPGARALRVHSGRWNG